MPLTVDSDILKYVSYIIVLNLPDSPTIAPPVTIKHRVVKFQEISWKKVTMTKYKVFRVHKWYRTKYHTRLMMLNHTGNIIDTALTPIKQLWVYTNYPELCSKPASKLSVP